jgi:paraquat-inducible protein B
VTDTTGAPLNLDDPEWLREQIENGLRAQLQLESIVTGKLYVELTYVSTPTSTVEVTERSRYLEIPTVLSPLAKLGEGASGLMTNLRQFDVTQINENLVTFLVNANEKLEQLKVEEINRSILTTVESVRTVVESDEVRATLQDLPKATEELRATISDAQQLVQRFDEGVDPTADELKKTSRELRTTLQRMQGTMKEIDQTLSTDSGIGYQMEEALSNLSEATEALRVLVQSLERNPSMFLRGREEPPPQNQQP